MKYVVYSISLESKMYEGTYKQCEDYANNNSDYLIITSSEYALRTQNKNRRDNLRY